MNKTWPSGSLLLLVLAVVAPAAAQATDCACGICCNHGICWIGGPLEPCGGEGDPCEFYTECGAKTYSGMGTFVKQAASGRCVYRCTYSQTCSDHTSCREEPIGNPYTQGGTDKFKTIDSYSPGQCPAFDCANGSPAAEITTE